MSALPRALPAYQKLEAAYQQMRVLQRRIVRKLNREFKLSLTERYGDPWRDLLALGLRDL